MQIFVKSPRSPSEDTYFYGFNFHALDQSELERGAHLSAACDHAHGF